MNKSFNEIPKIRARVFRLYGMQKISRAQHDEALGLISSLEQVLSNDANANANANANVDPARQEFVIELEKGVAA